MQYIHVCIVFKCLQCCVGFCHALPCLAAQLCLTFCTSMDCSPPGSSVHGILQTRVLEWGAILFSRGSSQPRDWTGVSCIAGSFFTAWAIREAQTTIQISCNYMYICSLNSPPPLPHPISPRHLILLKLISLLCKATPEKNGKYSPLQMQVVYA